MRNLFTSESVARGHPDKICDQISDAFLDNLLRQDRYSRVAIETMVTTGSVHIAGEVTTEGFCDFQRVARRVLKDIGYTDPRFGIDCEDAGIWASVHEQSPDIARGVADGDNHEQGAGDQGMMFGYACMETSELMPAPLTFAHRLVKQLEVVRKEGIIPHLGPDGKSQVTIEYWNGKPSRLEAVVIAQQHTGEIDEETLREMIKDEVIIPVCGDYLDLDTKLHINATGRFVVGGPEGDTGVTGRKIIVDTYGGMGRHGGGAFSGKDPSKVDRSAAYMARHVAKSIVANKLADRCEVQISYSIGVAKPVSIRVETFETAKIMRDDQIADLIDERFDLRPRAIIEYLDLLNPNARNYEKTACYGHFGREEPEFSWEKVKEL